MAAKITTALVATVVKSVLLAVLNNVVSALRSVPKVANKISVTIVSANVRTKMATQAKPKPRPTFEFKFEWDPSDLGCWKWNTFYNGFSINFGLLGFSFRIKFVRRNSM